MQKFQYYAQLADETAVALTKEPQKWLSFLSTASQLYKYPYCDQLLIYAQKPDAVACASYDIWNRHMGRYIQRGSQGIALLDNSGSYPRIKYVFDLADTRESDHSRSPNLWEYRSEHESGVRKALEEEYQVDGISFPAQLSEIAKFEIDDYWYANKEDILRNIENSMLMDYDEDSIRQVFIEVASVSTEYVLLNRCGQAPDADPLDYLGLPDFNTPRAVLALGSAVSTTSEEILRQIEAVVKAYDKEQKIEGSRNHEQTQLHSERRLPDPRPAAEEPVDGASGEVRNAAENVPQRTPTDYVEHDGAGGNLISPSEGDRRGSTSEAGSYDAETAEGSGSDRSNEAQRSSGMGSPDDHSEGAGRGSNSEGTGLRITQGEAAQVSFFPTEQEQIEYLNHAEDAEIAPSAFQLPQEITDLFLIHGSNTVRHRMAILSEFSKERTSQQMNDFLCGLYHGGNGIEFNGKAYSAWYAHDGIHITTGHTARYARTAQIISWSQAAQRITELIDKGQFATNLEISEAPGYERQLLAEKLWYLQSDLSDTGLQRGLLPTIHDLHGGFPTETALLSGFLNDTASIQHLSQEMDAFLEAYKQDRSVLRFHYHNPQLLANLVKEQLDDRREFHSSLTSISPVTTFITEDEIETSFMRGSGIAGGKDRIYGYFTADHTRHEQADYLKKEYGTGGRSHALSGSSGSSEDHDSKGITLRKDGCDPVFLTWEKAAHKLAEMIRLDHYLSPQEAQEHRAIQEAHEPEPDTIVETQEHDEWEDIDTDAVKARLEEHGIVNGEVVDHEALDNSPFIRQVMADVERIAAEDRISEEKDQLAEAVDALAYDFDTYEYNDRVMDRNTEVSRLQAEIHSGRTGAIQNYLTSILAGTDAGYAERAYTLLTRLNELVPEPTAMYAAYPNEYSHNDLDRMNIQEIKPDGAPGETLGSCRAEKSVEYVAALNSGKMSPQEVRTELAAEAEKWHCYIIPDLMSWNSAVAGDRPRTAVEYFDSYDEAKQRFMELRTQSYNAEDLRNPENNQPLARLTLGIQREFPPGAADLLHVRSGLNYLVDDFTRMSALNTSKEVMDLLQQIQGDLGFDRIRVYEKDAEGIYLPPRDMAFADWENPYFSAQPEEQLYLANSRTLLHIQTADSGFDYTLYDRESGQDMDGGILENPGISMASAVREICQMYSLSYESIQEQDLTVLEDLISKPVPEMNILEMVEYGMDQGMSEEQANDFGNAEWQARQDNSETAPQLTQEYQTIVDAMSAGGFTYRDDPNGNTIQFTDSTGYPLTFNSWSDALQWLETAEFKDNPELRTAVQAVLHTDREYAAQNLVPGVTEFMWDDRRFLVESLDLDNDNVELRDLTFQNASGFPIFRSEHLGAVRQHLEQLSQEPANQVFAENYHIIDKHLGEGGPKAKYMDNIRAIELLKQLEIDGRQAAPDEQEILSRYVGWGGLADAFDPNKPAWKQEYDRLKETLTPEEYDSAKSSTLTAHYTSPTIIHSVYEAVESMGFRTGNVLEPAMGTGNFFGMLPPSMEGSRLYGIELDSVSGRIAKQLYPQADITIAGFETTDRKDFYDLVVGNVPFGNYQVNDRAYNKYGFSIHNYFIGKSIDQIRPGGLVAVLSSRYTMDAKNSSARRYMAERAELLGAIRLPNDAFKANAGTEVVSDILFFQKREHPIVPEADWIESAPNEQGHRINQYFLNHPEMVLGIQTEHSSAHGMDYTVEPGEIPLEEALKAAVQHIKGSYHAVELPDLSEDSIQRTTVPADPNVKNYSYAIVDGELYFRENSIMYQPEVSESQAQRIKGMIEIREIMDDLIAYQVEDYPEAQIQEKQAQLNDVYDAFTKQYGILNSKTNEKAFSDDDSYYRLAALEHIDEDGALEKKADMFFKRTIRATHEVERVDSPSDALIASLGNKGQVDLPYMSRLLGGTEIPQITDALQGAIYRDPSLPEDHQWVTADEYLSGNVREKLAIAQREASTDSSLAINVKALTEAQPKPLEATEIDVRLGATWVDTEYIQQFMEETFNTPYYRRYKVKVEYSSVTGEWKVGEKGVGWGNDVMATSTYGTTRATAYQILEDSLNLRDVRVNDYIEVDGKKKTVLNQRETTLAAQKQQAIQDAFADWIWKDPERRNTLVDKYNVLYNSTRPREYDGSFLVFGGINPSIVLREHQVNAIAHIVLGGNTLLAHEVGAGKSFEMIGAAMESKRLGQCEKSLFVVPNHLTLQWANEFLRLYPAANILVTSKKDFEPANRKKFCSKIATGSYDAIIIGQSQFEKIPVSVERQQKTIEDQLQEIEDAIYDQRWSGKTFTVKQLEKTKKSLEARLEKLMAEDRKDNVVCFEQLGVDRLFVDESQAYKNCAKRCA